MWFAVLPGVFAAETSPHLDRHLLTIVGHQLLLVNYGRLSANQRLPIKYRLSPATCPQLPKGFLKSGCTSGRWRLGKRLGGYFWQL